jgi:hypothetical protein
MITETGYSKDPSIVAEGIAITWLKEMVQLCYGSLRSFIKHFEECVMDEDGGIWYQKCKNKPKADVLYVYIIYGNRLRYRCQFVSYEKGETVLYDGNGAKPVDWGRVGMTGPMVRCPFNRKLKGFQGFRYTTKLF